MLPHVKKVKAIRDDQNLIHLVNTPQQLDEDLFSIAEFEYLKSIKSDGKQDVILLNRYDHQVFVVFIPDDKAGPALWEFCRRTGDSLIPLIREHKISNITLVTARGEGKACLALAEGMILGNYQFLNYRKDKDKKAGPLKEIGLFANTVSPKEIDELLILSQAVYRCRDLVNEPLNALSAVGLATEFEEMAKDTGIKVDVLNMMKIESLKMGGLLAVNRGSVEPPTLTIYEWKPEGAINERPLILVGKGVVYDTGGLNLKSAAGMDNMKSDMAGAAVVACTIWAAAKAKLPLFLIGLMPATENRPNGNAIVPGDIVKMYDGTTVEVLNTDAEGRLILADALSYARKYDPLLVIDIATLTGAAFAAIGRAGMVAMGNADQQTMESLMKAGDDVYERLAVFPFWDDYAELIKSEVADLKNVGGKEAGAITAGKFLEHFIAYPWIHLDIAGPAFISKRNSYRGLGGTGVGLRLLFNFLKNRCI